jgi:protein TonB
VFDEVTKTEGGKRAARKGAYIFGSTLFQVLFVVAMIVVGERIRAAAKAEAAVEVKFIRAAPPVAPPPPPAAKRKTENKPKTDAPRTVVPPTAMIQPKDVTQEMKPPNPNEPPEPEADEGGFRAPREKNRGCLQSSMRVPPALQGFVSGPITVKFAVRRDGSIGQVQVVSNVPDPRIKEIIARGLAACEWAPGADAQGNPTSIWVIMPIRFAGG